MFVCKSQFRDKCLTNLKKNVEIVFATYLKKTFFIPGADVRTQASLSSATYT